MIDSVFHLVVRVRGRFQGLCEQACAVWLWQHVREAFPLALACALMPDHLHLLAAALDGIAARHRLARVLAHASRQFGLPGFDAVEATPVHTPRILARTVRYIVRNACNDRLVTDPLMWPWSTHRDVIGAIADPWVDAKRLARALQQPERGFVEWIQRYVSRDAELSPHGSPLPVAARPAEYPVHALPDFARAAASALRGSPADIRERSPVRHLFVQLATTTGWRDRHSLAAACRASRSTISRLSIHPSPGLDAGLLCLGDARLLHASARRFIARAA